MAKTQLRPKAEQDEEHSQKAYKGIRRLLYQKELVPGQKVSCRELASKLDMSLTPIIQALKIMELQGFVRHEPNRGYFMTPFSLQEVQEIYGLRQLIEPALIPAVVQHIDADGLSKLKQALDAHISEGPAVTNSARLIKNAEFHLTLAGLSRMQTHVQILRQLYNLLYLKYSGGYIPVAFTRSVDHEHQKIFEAVCARDATTAQAELANHLAQVKSQVLTSARNMAEAIDVPEF
jgi:DNA-binding GntR family transcriptional regulator